jgi:hypothetical protein
MRCICGFVIVLLFVCYSGISNAAVGCKVPGGNSIYTSYTTYLLGVKISSGLTIGIGANIYEASNPLFTDVSCSTSWVNSYTVIGSCIYGHPTGIPIVLGVCNDCLGDGELVNYTTTLECNLDDYSLPLAAAASFLGIFVIRRRNKL